MDGIHDLGGMHGFGPVIQEPDEPAFHARWEAAVFTMLMAAGRAGATGNADRFRHAIERIDPVAYLSHGYYGRWLGGLETLLVEAGLIDQAALTARTRRLGAPAGARIAARPAEQPDVVAPPSSIGNSRSLESPPRFATGDPIRTRTNVTSGHTRLPRYARGKAGRIVCCHDGWVYPDRSAHGGGEAPEYLYTVAFTGPTLWGPDSDPSLRVHLDLFEPYLEFVPHE